MMAILKRFHRRIIRVGLVAFWALVFSWMLYEMQARGFDPAVLEDGDGVDVTVSSEALSFELLTGASSVGVIFYPGALVDPEAYAPLARAVAEAGYKMVVVKVPYRLDLFAWQSEEVVARTEVIIAGDADRTAWIVGGHSRGGRMAAHLVSQRRAMFEGLLLVGTSHSRETDLSGLRLDVVKVYGSEDGLPSEEEVEAFAHNLPDHTRFVRVEGGNHRQFGYYGWQLGDGDATIDRAAQKRATAETIVEQLARVE